MYFKPEEFYRGFQVNHFDHKQLSNKYLLDLKDEELETIISPVINRDIKDFKRSILMDIRLTCLLSIETLFELIFGLMSDEENVVNDKSLIQHLVKPTYNSNEIRNFSDNLDSKLDRLFDTMDFRNGRREQVVRHIFFFGLWKEELEGKISTSLITIKNALKILSTEIKHREEINSYKHGFRGVNFLKSIGFADAETQTKRVEFDVENSLTTYSYNDDEDSHFFRTKKFDFKRDTLITHFVSNLIGNVIIPRTALDKSSEKGQVFYNFFNQAMLDDAFKPNVSPTELEFKIEPSKSDE